jgi:hypothetical protein
MNLKRSFAVAMMTAATTVAVAAPAMAGSYQFPQAGEVAHFVPVNGQNTVARVSAEYRCYGGPGSGEHSSVVWSSVKQGGPDPTAEGSSSTVNAWYDSHTPLSCDGKWHRQVFLMQRHATDFGGRSLGKLKNGPAWLQFCITDSHGSLSSTGQWVRITGA